MIVFKKAFLCLTQIERRQSIGVLILIILMALLDVVGVASIMPFLAVMANPSMIETNQTLSWLYNWAEFNAADDFLIFLGSISFVMLIVSASVRSLAFYAQSLFVQIQRHNLGFRLLEGYLHQPYEFFLHRNSGDMSKNILSEVDLFIDRALMPMAKMISHGLVSVLLLALLIFVDPIMAFIVFGVLAGTYLVIFRVIRESLSRIGQERIEANRQRFTAVGEALGGIKTIKILEREARYLRRFREPSYIVARKMAATSILSQLPRYIVEAIGFGGIILIALTLTFRQSGDSVERLGSVLPLLGLYAFAGFRLLPAIQNIYQNMVSLRFAAPAVDTIAHELNEAKFMLTPSTISKGSLPIKRAITLENVTYHYPNSEGTGINEVSLVVPKGNSLGIIGTTGAGKTTLVDVILGLLVPVAGRILIDDVPITNENRRAWQDNLGYVPQDIYLTDSTVAQNIAFGLLPNEIDMTRIEDCARMARIHEFVSQELPQGYATQVGELGVRLSGGQRQRIGIARALYHDPEVIVFDEATSALDTETESEVLEAISTLSGHKTLIIIAHRLTTVEACDEVIRLVAGRVVDE